LILRHQLGACKVNRLGWDDQIDHVRTSGERNALYLILLSTFFSWLLFVFMFFVVLLLTYLGDFVTVVLILIQLTLFNFRWRICRTKASNCTISFTFPAAILWWGLKGFSFLAKVRMWCGMYHPGQPKRRNALSRAWTSRTYIHSKKKRCHFHCSILLPTNFICFKMLQGKNKHWIMSRRETSVRSNKQTMTTAFSLGLIKLITNQHYLVEPRLVNLWKYLLDGVITIDVDVLLFFPLLLLTFFLFVWSTSLPQVDFDVPTTA